MSKVRGSMGPCLAAALAGKDAVDERCLGHLPGGLRVQPGQRGLVHGVQQCHQVLMRILLPAPPEAAAAHAWASQ
jgi:hypothetical protein